MVLASRAYYTAYSENPSTKGTTMCNPESIEELEKTYDRLPVGQDIFEPDLGQELPEDLDQD